MESNPSGSLRRFTVRNLPPALDEPSGTTRKGAESLGNWDAKNITSFAEQLSQIKIAIRDGAIFFDDDDYLELQSLVHAFGAFGAGKNLIAHLESPLLLDEHDLSAWRRRVYQNRQLKDEYEALLEKIRISLEGNCRAWRSGRRLQEKG